jgi:ABC-type Fe3+/spermidine/putrescine transport system ATPase subunit
MNAGRLAQVGTPDELYHRPGSAFVAEFIGDTNLIAGEVIEQVGKQVRVRTAMGEVVAESDGHAHRRNVTLSIRPEQLEIVNGVLAPARGNRLKGQVVESAFFGESSEHVIEVHGQRVRVIATPPRSHVEGEIVVEFDAADVVVLES